MKTIFKAYLRWLLIIVGVVVLGIVMSRLNSTRDAGQSVQVQRCEMAPIYEVMAKMKEVGVIYKVENGDGSPIVYVMDPWYLFPIDSKRQLDYAIRCDATGIKNSDIYVHYWDYRTGKKVAISSASGLSIE